ncbi:MFS transporter [Rothia sp. HC945]|uniref:MFS transporter n=1 Tax=Rothia sp. HC945 TaxID=3171170 RepID=UPI003F286CC1
MSLNRSRRLDIGRSSGVASSFNWIGSFAVGLLFPIMTASMPQEAVFAIFGVVCILGVLFVKFFVPETRGRTLEDIETNSMPVQQIRQEQATLINDFDRTEETASDQSRP